MPPDNGSPSEQAGTGPPPAPPADVAESVPALDPPQSDAASSGDPLRRRRRRRRRRPAEAAAAPATVVAGGSAEGSRSPGEPSPEVRQTEPSGAGEPHEQRAHRRRRRRRPPRPGGAVGLAAGAGFAMQPPAGGDDQPAERDGAAPAAAEANQTLHLRAAPPGAANAGEPAADPPSAETGDPSAAGAPGHAGHGQRTAAGTGVPGRRRRRRAAPATQAASGAGAPGARQRAGPLPGAEPRPGRAPRRRQPRSAGAGEPGLPRSATGSPRERSATDRREPGSRDRDARRGGPRSEGRASGRRPGRGRDAPPNRPAPKLYMLESMVDRGFEDVADDAAENAARRVHWTIVKRSVADQNSGKPMSTAYVLQREGAETEFANLGAARAAANKTIIHPEKLTLSKAEHAAAKNK
ncbi:MAG TPA: hypothetical protein VGM07_12150 [Stellaceae bacterium]